jgi:hypothetical protein
MNLYSNNPSTLVRSYHFEPWRQKCECSGNGFKRCKICEELLLCFLNITKKKHYAKQLSYASKPKRELSMMANWKNNNFAPSMAALAGFYEGRVSKKYYCFFCMSVAQNLDQVITPFDAHVSSKVVKCTYYKIMKDEIQYAGDNKCLLCREKYLYLNVLSSCGHYGYCIMCCLSIVHCPTCYMRINGFNKVFIT